MAPSIKAKFRQIDKALQMLQNNWKRGRVSRVETSGIILQVQSTPYLVASKGMQEQCLRGDSNVKKIAKKTNAVLEISRKLSRVLKRIKNQMSDKNQVADIILRWNSTTVPDLKVRFCHPDFKIQEIVMACAFDSIAKYHNSRIKLEQKGKKTKNRKKLKNVNLKFVKTINRIKTMRKALQSILYQVSRDNGSKNRSVSSLVGKTDQLLLELKRKRAVPSDLIKKGMKHNDAIKNLITTKRQNLQNFKMSGGEATPKAAKALKATVDHHPSYAQMVNAAIATLKDRKGSSRQAIVNYIMANYRVGTDQKAVRKSVKDTLKTGIQDATISQEKAFFKAKTAKKPAADKKAKKAKKLGAAKKVATAKKPTPKKASKTAKSTKYSTMVASALRAHQDEKEPCQKLLVEYIKRNYKAAADKAMDELEIKIYVNLEIRNIFLAAAESLGCSLRSPDLQKIGRWLEPKSLYPEFNHFPKVAVKTQPKTPRISKPCLAKPAEKFKRATTKKPETSKASEPAEKAKTPKKRQNPRNLEVFKMSGGEATPKAANTSKIQDKAKPAAKKVKKTTPKKAKKPAAAKKMATAKKPTTKKASKPAEKVTTPEANEKKKPMTYTKMVAAAIAALRKTNCTPCQPILVEYIIANYKVRNESDVKIDVQIECESRKIKACQRLKCDFWSDALQDENFWLRSRVPEDAVEAKSPKLSVATRKAMKPADAKNGKKPAVAKKAPPKATPKKAKKTKLILQSS